MGFETANHHYIRIFFEAFFSSHIKKRTKLLAFQINNNIFATAKDAEIAQLVEHDLAKVGVAGSSPVFRSTVLDSKGCRNGGIGRHEGLKIP